MPTTTTTTTTTPKAKLGRRTLRKLGRDKRNAKIVADKEFAKKLFDGKSKRAVEKKSAFRKKKAKK
jgi:hypothetical protein